MASRSLPTPTETIATGARRTLRALSIPFARSRCLRAATTGGQLLATPGPKPRRGDAVASAAYRRSQRATFAGVAVTAIVISMAGGAQSANTMTTRQPSQAATTEHPLFVMTHVHARASDVPSVRRAIASTKSPARLRVRRGAGPITVALGPTRTSAAIMPDPRPVAAAAFTRGAALLSPSVLAELVQRCASGVSVGTQTAVVAVESDGDAWALDDNDTGTSYHPHSFADAVVTANYLIAHDRVVYGRNDRGVDVGASQINSNNFAWLNVNAEMMLHPCRNLSTSSRMLSSAYRTEYAALVGVAEPARSAAAADRALEIYHTGRVGGDTSYATAVRDALGRTWVREVLALAGDTVPRTIPQLNGLVAAVPPELVREMNKAADATGGKGTGPQIRISSAPPPTLFFHASLDATATRPPENRSLAGSTTAATHRDASMFSSGAALVENPSAAPAAASDASSSSAPSAAPSDGTKTSATTTPSSP